MISAVFLFLEKDHLFFKLDFQSFLTISLYSLFFFMSSPCFLFAKEKNSSLQEHVKEIVKADRLDKVGKSNEKKTTGTLNWAKQN